MSALEVVLGPTLSREVGGHARKVIDDQNKLDKQLSLRGICFGILEEPRGGGQLRHNQCRCSNGVT